MVLSSALAFILATARRLPVRLAYALADLAADLIYLAWRPGRRRIRDNLRHVLATNDTPTLDYWGQRQLRRYAEYCVDALRLGDLSPADCHAALHADPADWERVRHYAARGPLIFALLHQGNWDIAGGAFTHNVGPSSVLVDSLGNAALDRWIRAQREQLGMRLVSEQAPRPALRALRDGGALGLLFDRPLHPDDAGPGAAGLNRAGTDCTFFGAPCRLPAGLARLALAGGARVIPMAVVRSDSRALRFHVEIGLDFDYTVSGDRAADVQALTQSLLNWFETPVRRHPDQWYMFRRFFGEA